MRTRTRIISALAALVVCLSALGAEVTGLVTRVADGDTLTLVDASGRQHKIRLWGIDCPEKNQSAGRQAGSALSKMVLRKNVRVDVLNVDRYKREVGNVYLGKMYVNLEMVRLGLAWHYVHYAPDAKDLGDAEKEARRKGIGIWAEKNPIPPWDFRKMERGQKQGK